MFSAALLLLLAAGCVKGEQLTQPASVTVQPGQRLTITCQVSYSLSSYWTHWIRQPAGKGLEWIGRNSVGSTPSYKASLKNKFSISLDSSSNTGGGGYRRIHSSQQQHEHHESVPEPLLTGWRRIQAATFIPNTPKTSKGEEG
ncbi:Ig heavy chain V region XIG14 [Takifugu flavidus]|uniref:Ig heavy chain V region XIG14 n=1 Tax=Takifugu flavidus TaxID=433684 RepID=A0A5C6NT48_9TELE|nr:Ig heavy chain V region XIG14 [Takifugu flavidus]